MVQVPKNRLAVVLKMGKIGPDRSIVENRWKVTAEPPGKGRQKGKGRKTKTNCDDNMMVLVIFLNLLFLNIFYLFKLVLVCER